MKAQSVEIKLLGQKVTMKTAAEPELVQQVVDLVSLKLKDAERRGKSQAPHLVALLALMDVAQEYVEAKLRATEHKRALDEKSNELLRLVEAELK